MDQNRVVNERDQRTVAELFAELSHETQNLFYQMMELAKAEMSEKATMASRDVAFIALGGAVAYAGFLALGAFLIILLGYVMPVWLSALLVGLILALTGFVLIQEGRRDLRRKGLLPRETVEELKEESRWAKSQMK